MKSYLLAILSTLLFSSISFAADEVPPKAALDAINAEDLLRHIKVLASDKFEGRLPGSKGEELSVSYISQQFKALGLKPGNPNGRYTQAVPLAGIVSRPSATFSVAGREMKLNYPDEYVASSARLRSEIKVANSEVIFVGYGIVAPEYGWDDYKDVDVRGKTILILTSNPKFTGNAMTYYGRSTYKFGIAAQKGAAAAVIIHDTIPASYPYVVLITTWAKENFELDASDKNIGAVSVRSWVTLEAAKKLLTASGQDFETLRKAALKKNFRPIALGVKANFSLKQDLHSFQSSNVVGKIEGSDPRLKNEWIVYSAHWDHLGKQSDLAGDQIFNGALDNASGVASILALAKAHMALGHPTRRSVLFMATTAEEAGLLGAKYYVRHPLYPLEKTVADFNIDVVNPWGKTRDVEDLTNGHSTLDDTLVAAAQSQQRTVHPDSYPAAGSFYRGDHFEFSKAGVPPLFLGRGTEAIGKRSGKMSEYLARDYHRPSDEVKPAWDLSGAAEDAQLLFRVGYRVANGDNIPQWKSRVKVPAGQ
ncbi:MAG: M28 family peptidase [Verrucomicrobiota bacterium]